jgi:hypothetical protein
MVAMAQLHTHAASSPTLHPVAKAVKNDPDTALEQALAFARSSAASYLTG